MTAQPLRPGTVAGTPRGVTVALFAISIAFGWILFGAGPVIPRLQADYGISRTLVGVHSIAFAGSGLLAALVTVPIMRRIRRGGALAYAGLAITVGAVMICAGPAFGRAGLVLSIGGFALTGMASSFVSTSSAAIVEAAHGARAGAVLAAIFGSAAVTGLVAPLAIGAGIGLGVTWRPGFLVGAAMMLVAVALVARVRHDPGLLAGPPVAAAAGTARPAAMPLRFWAILLVVMAGVALEFAFVVWSGDLLAARTPLAAAGSTAAVSGVIAGMATGRLVLSRVWRERPTQHTLLLACAVVAMGWALAWLATLTSVESAPLAVAGLVVSGAGIGGFFPLGVAWLISASSGRPEIAVSRLNVGNGVASGVAPFALGAVADRVGVHGAFLLVPGIVAVAVVCLAALSVRRS